MEFSFYKIRLVDSDYLLFNAFARPLPQAELREALSVELCHRVLGVGASGVVFLVPGEEHTARLYFYDRLGERRPCPPDAVLAASRFSFDFGLAQRERLRFEIEEGVREVRCIDSTHFRLSIDPPRDPQGKPIRRGGRSEYTVTLTTEQSQVTCTPLQFDIPAAAVYSEREAFLDEEEMPFGSPDDPVQLAGTAYHRIYYAVIDKEELRMALTGRRPGYIVSYAAACGTAAVLNGFCSDNLAVQYLGEGLFYQWDASSGEIMVTASPSYVFTGSYYYEEEEE